MKGKNNKPIQPAFNNVVMIACFDDFSEYFIWIDETRAKQEAMLSPGNKGKRPGRNGQRQKGRATTHKSKRTRTLARH